MDNTESYTDGVQSAMLAATNNRRNNRYCDREVVCLRGRTGPVVCLLAFEPSTYLPIGISKIQEALYIN